MSAAERAWRDYAEREGRETAERLARHYGIPVTDLAPIMRATWLTGFIAGQRDAESRRQRHAQAAEVN